MNGSELFENMLLEMESTTVDSFRTVIKESDDSISEEKITEVYTGYMEAVKQIRKEADEATGIITNAKV